VSLSGPVIVPVSALNVGLAAGMPVLAAKLSDLNLQWAELTQASVDAVLQTQPFNLPTIDSVILALNASFSPIDVALEMNPLTMTASSIDMLPELELQIQALNLSLALVGDVTASFQAGLNAPGLGLWTYAGGAAAFGQILESWNGVIGDPNNPIEAIIVLTESFGSWQAFGQGFNVGATAVSPVSGGPVGSLRTLGRLPGAELNVGVAGLFQFAQQYTAELEGLKAGLEGQQRFAVGLDLPSPDVICSVGLDVVANLGFDAIFDNLISLNVDFSAQIEGIRAQIDGLIELQTDLTTQLSAGGLAVWKYSGPANLLASAFAGVLTDGIPGGAGGALAPVYGVVIASDSPAAMASFGLIFG
jgi:hypothetical protein